MALLKVAMLCLEWPNEHGHSGGVGRYAFRLAGELSSRVDLTVICFEGGLKLDGVQFVEIPRTTNRFNRYYLTPLRLWCATWRLSPDLVHSNGDDWPLLLIRNMPLVRIFYGQSIAEAKSSRGLRRLNHLVLAVFELLAAKMANVKVAIAPDSARAFKCDAVLPPIAGEHPAVDNKIEPSQTPTAVFIGSFNGRKRGWLAERAVKSAEARMGRKVCLTVIGPVDDAKNWSREVVHVSGASDSEVAACIANSWLLIAPSSYEGFGIPAVEALDGGRAVVATANPGNRYLKDLGGADLPLSAPETDAEFIDEVCNRLQKGPALFPVEHDAAMRLLTELREMASVDALVRHYRSAIESHAGTIVGKIAASAKELCAKS